MSLLLLYLLCRFSAARVPGSFSAEAGLWRSVSCFRL